MVREGRDLTIVSWSAQVIGCANAAEALAAKGIDAEVIDLRTLWPWDKARVRRERRKDRAAARRAGVGLGRRLRGGGRGDVAERLHKALKAPVRRLGAPRVPISYAPPLEDVVRVSEAMIVEAAEKLVRGLSFSSPRLRGEGLGPLVGSEASAAQRSEGEGLGGAPGPSPGRLRRLDLSPHAGRGEDGARMSTNEMTGGEALARMIARPQGRADVRHGRLPALAVLRRRPPAGARRTTSSTTSAPACSRPTPTPRCRGGSALPTRRSARAPRTSSPGSSRRSTPARRWWRSSATATALHSWKNMTQESRQTEILQARVQGADPHRARRAHPRADAPRLRGRDLRAAGAGRGRRAGGHLPRRRCRSRTRISPPTRRHEAAPSLRCRPDRASTRARRGAARRGPPPARARRRRRPHLAAPPTRSRISPTPTAIPVAHTMTGKGAIACTDPLSAGLFGRYDRIANALIEEADVLLVVGCKLGEIATKRYTVPPQGQDAHPPRHRRRGVRPHHRARCRALGRRARRPRGSARGAARRASGPRPNTLEEVARRHERMARERRPSATHRRRCRSSMARLMGELNRLMPADGILVADGGFAAHWGGLLYDTKQARARLRAGPRLRLDRLRAAGRDRGGARRAGAPSREPHRRRRLQHDRSASSRPRGAWGSISRSSSSTTPPPATSRRCST